MSTDKKPLKILVFDIAVSGENVISCFYDVIFLFIQKRLESYQNVYFFFLSVKLVVLLAWDKSIDCKCSNGD